jgi:glycosyltransferase involved in cell wall biosynthesis
MPQPFVSIIVPVYNRETFVARCIDSVLQQDCNDYEIVAVDDGSSDQSVGVLSRYAAVRLIRHQRNMGVLRARLTGLQHAQGDWVIFLDSDDELVPGSLTAIHQRLHELPPDTDGALFCCKMDNGTISPSIWPPAVLDYESYLIYMNGHFGVRRGEPSFDFLHCIRTSRIEQLESFMQNGLEDLFQLEFYKQSKAQFFPYVARLYHQDADNQIVKSLELDHRTNFTLTLGRAASIESIIERHGPALLQTAPRVYDHYISKLALLEFLSGRRRKGFAFSIRAIMASPWTIRLWVIPLLGLFGNDLLAFVRSARSRMRGKEQKTTS